MAHATSDPNRPQIRVLVCKDLGTARDIVWRRMPLEDAVTYHQAGWAVFVDPEDEQALATYEREQRSQ